MIAETDGTGATIAAYTYDDAGQLFSMTRGGETYYYHTNARGDVVAMSDSQGAVVNTYSYDPWGQLLSENETITNPYRYASYRLDTAAGLYYCWNRYYAPELARFLTRDIYPGELSDPVTMSPYLYCGGDPVNAVDPSGLATTGMGWVLGGSFFGWGGSVSIMLVHGDQGNSAVAYSLGPQVGVPASFAVSRKVQCTSADEVFDLQGWSAATGGSVGQIATVGAEFTSGWERDGDTYSGVNLQAGAGIGMEGLPWEGHSAANETTIICHWNMRRWLGLE